ncbi:DNA translocase FtsK 4TM domain-containing protein [Patescibacteria group bacterium]|nr:DNA translocase FtsK 4TM domain-containing protein [Patescibacteria group bacterium]
MAKKNKKKGKQKQEEVEEIEREPYLKEHTVRIIYSILLFIVATFLVLSSIEKAGPIGTSTYEGLGFLLGIGYFILPFLLYVLGILFLRRMKQSVAWPKVAGAILFLLASLATISILYKVDEVGQGGLLGNIISSPLIQLFDFWVTLIFLLGIIFISTIIILDNHITLSSLAFWRRDRSEEEVLEGDEFDETIIEPSDTKEDRKIDSIPAPVIARMEQEDRSKKAVAFEKKPKDEFAIDVSKFFGKPYNPPPLSLLNEDRGKPGVGDIKANANIIKRTLQNFGINVEMDEISIGPSVTRYALKPAEGVKLSKIVGLQNDLALALAAHPIRIEAPIPGKSLVGIEIPNSTKTTVGLGTLFNSEEFKHSEKSLLVALGKGISGKSHFSNIAKAPHLLIAGATGSGKSVTIHTVITSLLYRNSPINLKFIMIDPKRVELTLYNKIPHLLTPVITDAKKAILALKWAGKEMDRRYDILEKEKVRDIESYHKNVLAPALKKYEKKEIPQESDEGQKLPEAMPYIVIIIDELADLMQAYPRELESAIVRLAQMSRAVGIHLILSTQRPSVNVITGLIKANVPSRIALQVASQIDSRTILDMAGAEKLLGAGDMLYLSADMSQPQRIQSAYISENELKAVVKFLIDNYADELPTEISLTEGAGEKNSIFESSFNGDDDAEEDDDLYVEARDIVQRAGKASTSYLQRKLSVGYARAARLIDMLEERGVIGPGSGSKPREVINPISNAAPSDEQSSENEPI